MTKTDEKKTKTCFVIMPITDPDGYATGHCRRVYDHLIKPACEREGLTCVRADEVKATNYIVIDILHRILESDLIVCDLSARNPNVLYELGICHAFNRRVVLIKDKNTDRVFDIQGLRTLDYDGTLRIDAVQADVTTLCSAIKNTLSPATKDVNSLVQLLGVREAELASGTPVSAETSLVLDAVRDLSLRMTRIEDKRQILSRREAIPLDPSPSRRTRFRLPSGDIADVGDSIFDRTNGEELGDFVGVHEDGIYYVKKGTKTGVIIPPDNEKFTQISTTPF